MPNYRSLSCMTLDGDEAAIASAISEDNFDRQCAKWYPKDDGYSRDPALVAFETGDHAPRGMTERPADAKSDKQRRRESEEAACEAWLARACPSGDAESVHNQWLRSDDYADWLDANPEPAASEPAKRGGWVMHNCKFFPPNDLPNGTAWFVTPGGVKQSRMRVGLVQNWHLVVAYSTDDECPEWTGV